MNTAKIISFPARLGAFSFLGIKNSLTEQAEKREYEIRK